MEVITKTFIFAEREFEIFAIEGCDVVLEKIESNKQRLYIETKTYIPKGEIKVGMKITYNYEKTSPEDIDFDEKKVEISFPAKNKPVILYLSAHVALREEGIIVVSKEKAAKKIQQLIK